MTKENAHLFLDTAESPSLYRIKPEPELVPLGPEDVPPGSVFNTVPDDTGWKAPVLVAIGGIVLLRADRLDIPTLKATTWTELMEMGAQIKRPGEDWSPCAKPVTATNNL